MGRYEVLVAVPLTCNDKDTLRLLRRQVAHRLTIDVERGVETTDAFSLSVNTAA